VQETQLALSLNLKDDCTFESYVSGSNANNILVIQKILSTLEDAFIYLWGKKGVGCSHLLQAACHYVSLQHKASFYISLDPSMDASSVFQNLERTDLVCLDNLERVAGLPDWEEALFHLYNRLKDAKKKLIVAANMPPKGLAIKLPDLHSRLQWGVSFQIFSLEDNDLVSALQLRAKQRGITLSKEVCEFIIKRVNRSMSSLYQILEQLDELSLTMKRNLTIPFVKMVLKL
jgi:DnaA family protein